MSLDHTDDTQTVSFINMADGTAEDYAFLAKHEETHIATKADRVLEHLKLQAGGFGGYKIDRLAHSLQSATRAERDGLDEEWIFAALMHDIGDTIAPENHSEMAASIIRPYVRREIYDVVKHHGLFQGYYYFHHYDMDRNARDQFREASFFKATVRFCERYDQNCFDPDFDTLPLTHFEPLVREILSRKPAFGAETV